MNSVADLNWIGLPDELKQLNQWCLAGDDKSPHVVDRNSLVRVKVTQTSFMSFEDACQAATHFKKHIGFVLTANDPYTVIDLDVKDNSVLDKDGNPVSANLWTTKEQIERYESIVNAYDTYSELSKSGKGVHVICKGGIGAGRRRQGVEIYSQERFIICTGKYISGITWHWNESFGTWDYKLAINGTGKPIQPRQELLNNMVQQLIPVTNTIELDDLEPEYTDAQIMERACNAGNKDKFIPLSEGKWQELGYPSQSEADTAFMSMLTFYSKSNSQCRRLFRYSGLGKREKAVKDDVYLNRTLKLIRSREEGEEILKNQVAEAAKAMMEKAQQEKLAKVEELNKEVSTELVKPKDGSTPWPPGIAGEIAKFIYHSSPRPVKEVSIVSALGLLAGIAGKAYNIPQSGLNQYIVLVARSGIGKEAMHSGISLIINRLRQMVPMIQDFVDFTDYVSGPALKKAVSEQPSMINISGEFGKKLKRMSIDDGRDGPMNQLRTAMTDLYQKSAASSVVGGLGYSNKDKNVKSVKGVSYSMIGETTPRTFYEALTESMMEDGFLSRFTIIEYTGKRPPANENPVTQMPEKLVESLAGLSTQALNLISTYNFQQVGADANAIKMMKNFDKQCDKEINSSSNESYRQMWNRAHLKTLRLAALLAVADNWIKPVINTVHYKWALDVVNRDIALMRRKLEEGDVGNDDVSRELKLLHILNDFATSGVPASSYGVSTLMYNHNVVPKRYLATKTNRVNCFFSHKLGSNKALNETIGILIDNGYLAEVPKTDLASKFNFHGKAYYIVKLKDDNFIKNT